MVSSRTKRALLLVCCIHRLTYGTVGLVSIIGMIPVGVVVVTVVVVVGLVGYARRTGKN
jgi:hypothetical protein